MAKNLITLAEYKAYAGLTSPNHDAEILQLIPKISELVKTYCKRTFVDWLDDPKLEHFNGGYQTLLLEETPVSQILEVGYSSDYGQTYTPLVEYRDWVLDGNYIVSVNPAGFSRVLRGYRVTYLAGYETVPEDLKLAVLDLVTYYRKNDMAVHSSKAPGTNTVQIEYVTTTSLPAHIRRVLDFYRADYA